MNGDFLFEPDRLLRIYENHNDDKCIMRLVTNFSRFNKFSTPGQAHCVMLSDHSSLFFTVYGKVQANSELEREVMMAWRIILDLLYIQEGVQMLLIYLRATELG